MARVIIDPITRIEGHLSIEIDVEAGRVVDARCRGDMFRGYEKILRGRNPVDANQITQRICGVCPVSHGIASSKCLEAAFSIKANKNGRILRNLALAANYLHSHLIHFYHLAALDFVDITAILQYKGSDSGMNNLKDWAKGEIEGKKGRPDEITSVGPFLPRYEGKGFYIKDPGVNLDAIAGYVKALDIRMKAHKMVALLGGRVPHLIGLVPGGMTQVPTRDKISEYRSLLKDVEKFVNNVYVGHVIAVAKAFPDYFKIGKFNNMMSYGLFDLDDKDEKFMLQRGVYLNGAVEKLDTSLIREQVAYSRYSSGSNLHPLKGETEPNPNKGGAYTWLKAPRYRGQGMEVGPLARVLISYLSKNQDVVKEVDAVLKIFNTKDTSVLFSVLGRHAARAVEAKLICRNIRGWIDQLEIGGKPREYYEIPDEGEGEGLVEASRGALGHWIVVKNRKIENYQAVVPTTWFCGPRDDNGVRGPVETALLGTPISDVNNPIEAARVVRSFDPCIACAVHVMEGGREMAKFKVV